MNVLMQKKKKKKKKYVNVYEKKKEFIALMLHTIYADCQSPPTFPTTPL